MSSRTALTGRRVVITRPENQAESLARGLERLGATALRLPSTRLEPIEHVPGLNEAIRALSQYDWAVFTSVNGVNFLWQRFVAACLSSGEFERCSVAAIGPTTAAALQEKRIAVDFVPGQHIGERLAEEIPDVEGRRVFLPTSADARPELPKILRERGAVVDKFFIYRTVEARPDNRALAQLSSGVDAVTFTSPSTVAHFLNIVRSAGVDPFKAASPPVIACIGPVTVEAAESEGLAPTLVARDHTVPGLIEALVGFFEGYGIREQS